MRNNPLEPRFQSLDGWRAISILAVLAAHLLPLGPHEWSLNLATGMFGMVFFFTLSGFLVTHFLLRNSATTTDFLLRRFFRIIPLAWAFMAVGLTVWDVPYRDWPSHFLFYANFPPQTLVSVTAHLWSLCVEVQFYLGIALLFLLFRQRGLLALPLLCVSITVFRVLNGEYFSGTTWFRIDEILAGTVLALIYHEPRCAALRDWIGRLNPLYVLPLLLISCHPEGAFMNYLRPYFGALLVGITLFGTPSRLTRMLDHRVLVYIASISFALYVFHPGLENTWLGSGDRWGKYAKRPLLFALLFLFAHLSTRLYEQPWIAFGKRLSARIKARKPALEPVEEK